MKQRVLSARRSDGGWVTATAVVITTVLLLAAYVATSSATDANNAARHNSDLLVARAAGLSGEDLLYSAMQSVSPTTWLPGCSTQPCSFTDVFPPDLSYTPSTWVQVVNGGVSPCTDQAPVSSQTCLEIRDELQSDPKSPPGVALYEVVASVDVRTNCRTGSWDQSAGQPSAGNCVYARVLERFQPRQYTNYLDFAGSELLDPALYLQTGGNYTTWGQLCTQPNGSGGSQVLADTATSVLANPSVCQVPAYLGASGQFPGDNLDGTVATNDATVYSCGHGSAQPTFQAGIQATSSPASSEYPDAIYPGQNTSNCTPPAPGPSSVVQASPLPTSSNLPCIAAVQDSYPQQTPAASYCTSSSGPTTPVSIVLNGQTAASSTYTVTQNGVQDPPQAWPANGVIYANGPVSVSGETCLPLTIAGGESISVTGNLWYNPSCNQAVLGLVASWGVTVQPSVANNQVTCWPSPVNGQCMTVEAAVMALGTQAVPNQPNQPQGGSFSLTGWDTYAPPNLLSASPTQGYDSTISQYSPATVNSWALTDTCTTTAADANGDTAYINGQVNEGQTPGPLANATSSPAMGFTGTAGATAKSLGAGVGDGAAVGPSGNVFTWGNNASGQLGNNNLVSSTTPVGVAGVGGSGCLSGINQVAVGNGFMLALSTSGNVYAWGAGGSGELGNNSTTASQDTPVEVQGVGGSGYLSGVKAIATDGTTGYALSTSGNVYAWGAGGSGQLGNNSTTASQDTPVEVDGVGGSGSLSGVTAIAAGSSSAYALTTSGNVYAWGAGGSGQLGNDATTTAQSTPVEVKGVGGSGNLSSVTAISAGGSNAAAVSSGGVDVWGSGSSGQLGNGATTTTQSTPVEVEGTSGSGTLGGINNVSVGSSFVVAWTGAGAVYAWGANGSGQLGNGGTTNESHPVQVVAVGGTGSLVAEGALVAGATFVLASATNGTVVGWGDNSAGELAATTPTSSATPVGIGPLPIGPASYLTTSNPTTIGGQQAITITAWFKTSSAGPLVSFDSTASATTATADYLQLWMGSDGTVHVGTNVGGVNAIAWTPPAGSGTALTSGWHLATVTMSTTQTCLYVDGVQSASGCAVLPTIPATQEGYWWIAGAGSEAGWPSAPTTSGGVAALNGSEGRVAILPGILTLQQVANLYNSAQVNNSQCTTGINVCALVFDGSITEAFQGAFGTYVPTTTGPAVATGVAKQFSYDQNLAYRQPPYFLQPVSGAWQRQGAVFSGGLSS